MKKYCLPVFFLATLTGCGGGAQKDQKQTITGAADSAVQVLSPSDNSTVGPQVHYVANATTSCAKGIASLDVYSAPGVLAHSAAGANLDTTITLSPGAYHTSVQASDNCGGTATTPVNITVSSSPPSGVQVSSPTDNSTVTSQVHYVASASTSCAAGIGSIGVYSAPGQLAYTANGSSLDTTLNFNSGTYNTTVQAWDKCGGSSSTPITITVQGGTSSALPSNAKTFSNLQKSNGWTGYGLLAPSYKICGSCKPGGPEVTWSTKQGVSSPSQSGSAMQFDIGGQTPYSDALWNNHLIGDFSSEGLPDTGKTLAPSLHNFVYDVYFYADNLPVSQALEFDINQFVNGKSFIWGHECRIAGGNEWDIWDNQAMKWHPTGIACKPKNNAWNHLTIQVQRTSDDQLLFQTITLNGKTATLNFKEPPTSTGWYGVTINYQMDGNLSQKPYSIWLDNVNFSYW